MAYGFTSRKKTRLHPRPGYAWLSIATHLLPGTHPKRYTAGAGSTTLTDMSPTPTTNPRRHLEVHSGVLTPAGQG